MQDQMTTYNKNNFVQGDVIKGFECFFTKDKNKIKDYIAVREYLFDSGGKKYNGAFMKKASDKFDSPENASTNIIVAYFNGICVGGARVVVKAGEELLPGLENRNFKLENILPELHIKKNKCAELSRFAVLPEYTNLSYIICDSIYEKCVELRVSYLMWMGDIKRTMAYKRICNRYVSELSIKKNIAVPKEFQSDPNIKKYLSVLNFSMEYQGGTNISESPNKVLVDGLR